MLRRTLPSIASPSWVARTLPAVFTAPGRLALHIGSAAAVASSCEKAVQRAAPSAGSRKQAKSWTPVASATAVPA